MVSGGVGVSIVVVSLVIVGSRGIVGLLHLAESPVFHIEIASGIVAVIGGSRSIDLEVIVIEIADRRR